MKSGKPTPDTYAPQSHAAVAKDVPVYASRGDMSFPEADKEAVAPIFFT